jgi:hypothetical protein
LSAQLKEWEFLLNEGPELVETMQLALKYPEEAIESFPYSLGTMEYQGYRDALWDFANYMESTGDMSFKKRIDAALGYEILGLIPQDSWSHGIFPAFLGNDPHDVAHKKLTELALVCKRWQTQVYLFYKEWISKEKNQIRDFGFKVVANAINFVGMAKLQILNLKGYNLTDRNLFRLMENCPGVKVLFLNSRKLTEKSLPSLKNLKNLQVLQLIQCCAVESLKFLRAFSSLKFLHIGCWKSITTEELYNLPVSLVHIYFTQANDISIEGLYSFKERLTKIKTLHIEDSESSCDCKQFQSLDFSQFSSTLESLFIAKHMDLPTNFSLSENMKNFLFFTGEERSTSKNIHFSSLPKSIECVDFPSCLKFNNATEFQKLSNVISLDISALSIDWLHYNFFVQLNSFTKLTQLILTSFEIDKNTIPFFPPNIEKLSLRSCINFGDIELNEIIKCFPKLQKLKVEADILTLTESSLKNIIHFTVLKSLSLIEFESTLNLDILLLSLPQSLRSLVLRSNDNYQGIPEEMIEINEDLFEFPSLRKIELPIVLLKSFNLLPKSIEKLAIVTGQSGIDSPQFEKLTELNLTFDGNFFDEKKHILDLTPNLRKFELYCILEEDQNGIQNFEIDNLDLFHKVRQLRQLTIWIPPGSTLTEESILTLPEILPFLERLIIIGEIENFKEISLKLQKSIHFVGLYQTHEEWLNIPFDYELDFFIDEKEQIDSILAEEPIFLNEK